MKIAFMGTPDFAVDCLKVLAESEHEVVGVFCQPDKPVGRKQELKMPDVKIEALKHDYKIFQPNTLRNGTGVEILKEINPDLVVVVAYGKLLPPDFLSFPKYGCINIHASILPKYRGASPIHWSVINGDAETGVTAMQMDEGLDTGDILVVNKMPIGENDTTEVMYEKLAPLGAKTLMETIELLEKGELKPVKQDSSKATNVGLLSKDMSVIDWNDTAKNIHNKIRGLYSWPGTSTKLNGKNLKIHSSVLSNKKGNNKAGEIVDFSGKLIVCCGDNNCIELKNVQLEGKKRMDAAAFLNGVKIEKGTVLGA
ncbi:MAG: methionyl-tRNA formyltransferase [Ruminococcus sp.]|nr:methionyl-tRNA formyltransferase [Ruminococcus sp.]